MVPEVDDVPINSCIQEPADEVNSSNDLGSDVPGGRRNSTPDEMISSRSNFVAKTNQMLPTIMV